MPQITPEDARRELARRELARRGQELPVVGGDQIKGTIATERMILARDPSMDGMTQTKKAAQMYGGIFTTKDEDARADIIRKLYPDAKFANDEEGNLVVRVDPDRPFMRVHTPGLDFTNDVIRFAPAAKVAGLGKTFLSRVGLAGLGGTATGYASEKASQALGSEQDTDYGRVALEGGAMMAGEAAVPAIMGIGQAVARRLPGVKSPAARAVERVEKLEGRRAVDAVKPLPGAIKDDVHIDPGSVPGGVVYHTTTKANLDRIMREGLSATPGKRTFDVTEPEYTFMATRDAASFWRKRIGEKTGAQSPDDLVTLEIPVDALEKGKLLIDREGFSFSGSGATNRLASGTFQYQGGISPDVIKQARVVSGDELRANAPKGEMLAPSRKRAEAMAKARKTGGEIESGVRALASEGKTQKRLNNADAAALTRLAREQGIPLTKGEATRDTTQMTFEDSARRGGRGQGAQKVFSEFDQMRERQVKTAAERLNPRYVAADLEDAGQIIGQGVSRARNAQNDVVRRAYRELENVNETVPAASLSRLAQDMRQSVPSGLSAPGRLVSPENLANNFPESSAILFKFEETAKKFAATPNEPISFRELMELRSSISLAQKGAQRGDRAALPQMKNALDEFVIREATDRLANGEEIAKVFRDAPNARALYGGLFQKSGKHDVAGTIIEEIVSRDYTGEKIANMITGGATKATSNTSLAVVKRMKEIAAHNAGLKTGKKLNPAQVAEKAPEFQAVRDAMLYTTFRKGFGVSGNEYKPQTLVTEMDRLLDGPGKSVMEELFTPQEILQMRNFRSVLKQTIPDKNAINASGSGDRMWANALSMIPILSNVKGAFQFANTSAAKAATKGVTEKLPQGPATTIFKSIGAAYAQNPQQNNRLAQEAFDQAGAAAALQPVSQPPR